MNKYKDGKIYGIVDNTNGNIYYGSTILSLRRRLTLHRSNFKKYKNNSGPYISIFKILENNDYTIDKIEDFPCNSKKELEKREGFYHKYFDCVNMVIAGRSKEQWTLDNKEYLTNKKKEYYLNNKDFFDEKQRLYKQNFPEKVKTCQKNYVEKNKQKILEEQKKYRKNNKSKLSEYFKNNYLENKDKKLEKIKCDKCDKIVIKCGLPRHKRTKYCLNYIESSV